VLVDQMDDRLKDLIAFVNENSRFSFYGVELDFYEHEGLEIVIPSMYSAEIETEVAGTSSRRRKWDEASFFQDAESHLDTDQLSNLRGVYEYFHGSADGMSWGSGARRGSFSPIYGVLSPTTAPISIFSDGMLFLKSGWLDDREPVRQRVNQLAGELSKKLEMELPSEYEDYVGNDVRIHAERWLDQAGGMIGAFEAVFDSSSD
jgi:hypothetical protein